MSLCVPRLLCITGHLLQVLSDLVEAPLQPDGENGVRVGDPAPDQSHHAAELRSEIMIMIVMI